MKFKSLNTLSELALITDRLRQVASEQVNELCH